MIAALELIQCRVIYLPTEADPIKSYQEQLYLTPNSLNIHARRMSLFSNLFIAGFTETPVAVMSSTSSNRVGDTGKKEDILLQKLPMESLSHEGDNDEMDDLEVSSGLTSIKIIEDIISQSQISSSPESETGMIDETQSNKIQKSNAKGIFILNYKYTHTLNHFLFHMPELLENAGINICIALSAPPPLVDSNQEDSDRPPSLNTSLHLPKKFGPLNIVTPVSLRLQKQYVILSLIETNELDWVFEKADILDL